MKTDYEKLKMRLRWAIKHVWFGNKELEQLKNETDIAKWFLSQSSDANEAIVLAFYLGRQDGRVALGTEVARCLGMDRDDIIALKESVSD